MKLVRVKNIVLMYLIQIRFGGPNMNEVNIVQVHSMLEETDTLISSSCKLSGRIILNMVVSMLFAVILSFYTDHIEYAIAISVVAISAVFLNLFVLGDYKTKIKMFEACSTSFKEKHLSTPNIRKKYESHLYEDLNNLLEITERYVKLYKIINIINVITGLFTIALFSLVILRMCF